MENQSVWKTVLSICITLFVLIRLAMTCSDYNNRKSNYNNNNNLLQNINYDYSRKIQEEVVGKKSNQLLY